MRRQFIGFLVVAAFVAGGSLVANMAYQAGLSTAITTVAQNAPAGSIVTPVVPGAYPGYGYGNGYGWGWGGPGFGHGFSIFEFLGTILFIFLIFGLVKAIVFRGRGWSGPGGPGGPGGWGGRHAHDTFETWHREAHDESGPGSSGSGSSGPSGGAGGA